MYLNNVFALDITKANMLLQNTKILKNIIINQFKVINSNAQNTET